MAVCAPLAAIALLGGLVWPAASGAASAEFTAQGSNGYTIRVKGGGGKVALTAAGFLQAASYTVPGRITRRGVVANFGRRGMIDVRFKPGHRSRIETPPNRCRGKPRVKRWGSFVGTIRFSGERGFTRLRVRRAGGSTQVSPRWRCERRGRAGAAGLSASAAKSEDASVVWEVADRRRGLEASALSSAFFGVVFFASLEEKRKRMQIRRSTFVPAKDRAFVFDESLAIATLRPPRPFAGKGTFRRRPGHPPSWTGSLSLVLPGTTRISLIGKRYRPRLYRLDKDGIAEP